MGIIAERSNDTKQDLSTIKGHLFNSDKNNMSFIYFEGVENPYQVLEIAKTQRVKLVPDKELFNDYKENQTEVKVFGQKVIVEENPSGKVPILVWLIFIAMTIFFLALPINNMISTLKIWNNYIKTTATITNAETINANSVRDESQDIKYFVNVSYNINSNNYESIITNDTCYLKSTQNFKGSTSHCKKYDSRFSNMKINDKVTIYVNPTNSKDIEFVPTLISSGYLILLFFGIVCGVFVIAIVKQQFKKQKGIKKTAIY
jgi:hypothetical protein